MNNEQIADASIGQKNIDLQRYVCGAIRQGYHVRYVGEGWAEVYEYRRPSHIIHALLTFVTLGLWLIPWLAIHRSARPITYIIAPGKNGVLALERVWNG